MVLLMLHVCHIMKANKNYKQPCNNRAKTNNNGKASKKSPNGKIPVIEKLQFEFLK